MSRKTIAQLYPHKLLYRQNEEEFALFESEAVILADSASPTGKVNPEPQFCPERRSDYGKRTGFVIRYYLIYIAIKQAREETCRPSYRSLRHMTRL